MTVSELQSRMTWPEFMEWRAWLRIKHGAPKTDEELMAEILERRAVRKLDARERK